MHKDRSVLIVDDDPSILRMFVRLLMEGHYKVTAVSSARIALEAIAQTSFDLVVLDLHMPGTDGFEMLKRLRETRPQLKVLVVSAYVEGDLLKASEIVGASASLPKQAAPRELLKTVDRLLR